MRIYTDLTRRLGIDLPLLGAGGPEAAAAVSEAGALGVLAAGEPGLPWLEAAIDQVQAATSRPFAVRPWPGDASGPALDLALARGVAAVLTSGTGHAHAGRTRAAGALHLHEVETLEHSQAAGEADGLLVRSNEFALLRQLRHSRPGLLLAWAGEADGALLVAALALGADAAAYQASQAELAGAQVEGVAAAYAAATRALPSPSVQPPHDPGRHSREAAALRDNLRKRKDQARARAAQP